MKRLLESRFEKLAVGLSAIIICLTQGLIAQAIPPERYAPTRYGNSSIYLDYDIDDDLNLVGDRSGTDYDYWYCKNGNELHDDTVTIGNVDLTYPEWVSDPVNDLFITKTPLLGNGNETLWLLPGKISESAIDFNKRKINLAADGAGTYNLYHILKFPKSLINIKTGQKIDSSTNNVIILIHGWNESGIEDPFSDEEGEWPGLVQVLLKTPTLPNDWAIVEYNWAKNAATGSTAFPDVRRAAAETENDSTEQTEDGRRSFATNAPEAAEIGHIHGQHLGELLLELNQNVEHVHFVAHSAGTWVARTAARHLLNKSSSTNVQVTFLDPFMADCTLVSGDSRLGPEIISALNDGAPKGLFRLENYYAKLVLNDITGPCTSAVFSWGEEDIQRKISWESGLLAFYASHDGPVAYYADTIIGPDSVANPEGGDLDELGWLKSMAYNMTRNPYPASGSIGQPVSLKLYWNNGYGKNTTFKVYFGTDPTPDAGELVSSQSAPLSYELTGLKPNTTYYWRVDAVNDAGEIPGDVWRFTTGGDNPGEPSEKYTYVGAGFYREIDGCSPKNKVAEFSQADTRLRLYIRLENVYGNGDFAPPIKVSGRFRKPSGDFFENLSVEEVPIHETGTWCFDLPVNLSLFDYPGVWSCEVRVNSEGSWITEEVLTLNVIDLRPSVPFGPDPGENEKNVDVDVVLKWSSDSKAEQFRVFMGSSNDFIEEIGVTSGNSFDPPGDLGPGTKYFWRVDAENAYGKKSSDTWSFTTATAPEPNASPSLEIYEPSLSNTEIAFNETSYNFFGIASDSDGFVNQVRYRLNNETEYNATGTANWNFTAYNLHVGANRVDVWAVDNDAAKSTEHTRTITRADQPGPDGVDLLVLTEYGDVWRSVNSGGKFTPAIRMASTPGFNHQIKQGRKTIAGDFDGDGWLDLAMANSFGQLWLALSNGTGGFEPPRLDSNGWSIDEPQGETILAGDFDGDGLCDLLQTRGSGDVEIGYNSGGYIGSPNVVVNLSLQWPYAAVADMNGDGRDDIVRFETGSWDGCSYVAFGTATGFTEMRELDGCRGMYHSPSLRSGIHLGDVNGDGRADVVRVKDTEADVALMSGGGMLQAPNSWTLGYHDNPARDDNAFDNHGPGWWCFLGDVNGDGKDDLIQLNAYGEVWVASSNGQGFNPPVKNVAIGFNHQPDGPWQVFIDRHH